MIPGASIYDEVGWPASQTSSLTFARGPRALGCCGKFAQQSTRPLLFTCQESRESKAQIRVSSSVISRGDVNPSSKSSVVVAPRKQAPPCMQSTALTTGSVGPRRSKHSAAAYETKSSGAVERGRLQDGVQHSRQIKQPFKDCIRRRCLGFCYSIRAYRLGKV